MKTLALSSAMRRHVSEVSDLLTPQEIEEVVEELLRWQSAKPGHIASLRELVEQYKVILLERYISAHCSSPEQAMAVVQVVMGDDSILETACRVCEMGPDDKGMVKPSSVGEAFRAELKDLFVGFKDDCG